MTSARQYAIALYQVGEGKDASEAKRLVESLVAHLAKRGHGVLLPAIAREYRRLTEHRSRHQAKVVLAREKDTGAFQNEIGKELTAIGISGTSPAREYDETLVGGYRVEFDGKVVDASYKTQLLYLYRKMTSA